MKDIFIRTPVNGTAARVVGQQDCVIDDNMTIEQECENLRAQVSKWQEEIKELPPKSRARKQIGKEIAAANLRINELKPTKYKGDLSSHILDIVKEITPRPQWNRIVEEAIRRMDADAKEKAPNS